MKKIGIFITFIFIIQSCEFIPTYKKDDRTPVAKVYEDVLYQSDIEAYLPADISSQDSVLFVKNYVDSWAKKQLLLHQAEINLKEGVSSFEKLVKDYRSTLYINSYKEALVLDKLDTTITAAQLTDYYSVNKENFKLNEELIKLRYLYINKERKDKKELIKLFRSSKREDLNTLNDMALEFKSFHFNDSIWLKYSDVTAKLNYLKDLDKKKVLKKSNFLQKEDSLGLYLVAVKEVLLRNEIAPINYVSPTIKQIILQKRKLELLRKIEVDLLNDAIKNEYFERY